MFRFATETIVDQQLTRYTLDIAGQALTWAKTLDLWSDNGEFRRDFTELLASSPFKAFRWETPAVSTDHLESPFEFVIINAPELIGRKPEPEVFASNFSFEETEDSVISFLNLGKDATLIIPRPESSTDIYGHLASFLRRGPRTQVDSMWKTVGKLVKQNLNPSPLWLNTAGGGVAWLHIRLDTRPKYYRHVPYRQNG